MAIDPIKKMAMRREPQSGAGRTQGATLQRIETAQRFVALSGHGVSSSSGYSGAGGCCNGAGGLVTRWGSDSCGAFTLGRRLWFGQDGFETCTVDGAAIRGAISAAGTGYRTKVGRLALSKGAVALHRMPRRRRAGLVRFVGGLLAVFTTVSYLATSLRDMSELWSQSLAHEFTVERCFGATRR